MLPTENIGQSEIESGKEESDDENDPDDASSAGQPKILPTSLNTTQKENIVKRQQKYSRGDLIYKQFIR